MKSSVCAATVRCRSVRWRACSTRQARFATTTPKPIKPASVRTREAESSRWRRNRARQHVQRGRCARRHRPVCQHVADVVGQLRHRGVAVFRIGRDGTQHHLIEIAVQAAQQRADLAAALCCDRRHAFAFAALDQLAQSRAGRHARGAARQGLGLVGAQSTRAVRALAGQQHVGQHAELIDVGGHTGAAPGELLGAGIAERARRMAGQGELAVALRGVDQLGDAEIHQPGFAARIHQHVAGLDVAMHDQFAVRVRGGVGDAQEQFEAPAQVEAVAVAVAVDRLAFDVLHHEVGPAGARQAEVVDLADVGMVEPRQDLLFAAEARQVGFVERVVEQQFDRDLLHHAVLAALGQIDLGAAAVAEAPDQAVGAEAVAVGQGLTVRQLRDGLAPHAAAAHVAVVQAVALARMLRVREQAAHQRQQGRVAAAQSRGACLAQRRRQLQQRGEDAIGIGEGGVGHGALSRSAAARGSTPVRASSRVARCAAAGRWRVRFPRR